MNSLIHPDQTWTLWALIVSGTCLAIWLEQTYRWAAKLSGPVLALLIAMMLSNFKVMPTEAPCYDFVTDYLLPLAIPLLLFRANIVKIARETGWMLVAFHISTLGTVLGAILAVFLLHGRVERLPELAGIMTASYVGGMVNFFAVQDSFATSGTLTGPLIVADNFIMAGILVALLFISGSKFFLRHYSHPHTPDVDATDKNAGDEKSKNLAAEHWRRKDVSLLDIAKALAVAFIVVAISAVIRQQMEVWLRAPVIAELISNKVVMSVVFGILCNKFVWITFVSMLVATIFHRQIEKINGADEMGGFMLYIFLFSVGLPADLVQVLSKMPDLFVFCTIIAVTNLVFTLVVGRLFNFDLEELLLCVNASIGGPPTAAAMAIAKGWSQLVLPALLVGIWGYTIGTFVGILVGQSLMMFK